MYDHQRLCTILLQENADPSGYLCCFAEFGGCKSENQNPVSSATNKSISFFIYSQWLIALGFYCGKQKLSGKQSWEFCVLGLKTKIKTSWHKLYISPQAVQCKVVGAAEVWLGLSPETFSFLSKDLAEDYIRFNNLHEVKGQDIQSDEKWRPGAKVTASICCLLSKITYKFARTSFSAATD